MATKTHPNIGKPQQLSPEARQLIAVVMNIVYDQKGVQMLQQLLQSTKNPKAIPAAVSTAASTILFKLKPKLDALPPKEVWGKMGVIHLVLDAIFEVAKELGYKAPLSALEPAYKAVEQALQANPNSAQNVPGQQGPPQGGPPQGAPPGPMQGAMPPQQAPNMGAPQ